MKTYKIVENHHPEWRKLDINYTIYVNLYHSTYPPEVFTGTLEQVNALAKIFSEFGYKELPAEVNSDPKYPHTNQVCLEHERQEGSKNFSVAVSAEYYPFSRREIWIGENSRDGEKLVEMLVLFGHKRIYQKT
jgi:hypothetical protein